MKQTGKKLAGMLLALVLLLDLAPLTAFADGEIIDIDSGNALSTALSNTDYNGKTLRLTADVTGNFTYNQSGKSITIDLNNHSIKGTATSGNASVIKISSGTLTVTDNSESKTTHYYYIGAESTYNSSCLGTIVSSESDSNYVNATRRGSFDGGYITGGYGTGYSGSTVFGGGVFVDGGAFILDGGCIFGNRLSDRDGGNGGGGVAVRQNTSSFVMNGGYIIGNHAGRFGGGIRIDGGSFTMNGGEVRHNTANTPGSGGAGCGGGVHMGGLDGGATVTITGGSIKGNLAGLKDGSGGGINVAGGTLTMTGGTVKGNSATLSGGGINGAFTVSGNVLVTDNAVGGAFAADSYILSGGTVSNVNLASGNTLILGAAMTSGAQIGVTMATPGGVFTSGWINNMGSAKPTDYFTSDDTTYNVILSNSEAAIGAAPVAKVGETEYSSFSDALTAWGDRSTLQLLKDVTTASTITVSGTKTLDLNGHGIRMTGTDSVITVASGAALTLNDSNPDVEHKFTVSNPASNGAGLAIVDDGLTSGYQTFTGGYITGGKGKNTNKWSNGGGIYLDANATVVMYGGTIIGNGRYDHTHGGALRTLGQGSNFTMYGGSLRNNEGLTGGAFRVSSGSVSIYGGSILYNRVSNDHGAISGDGALVLRNCEIRGNFAQKPSGGVMAAGSVSSVSGNTVIADNYVGTTPNNLQLAKDKVLTITDKLTNTVPIGVTMQTPGVFTSGWSTHMGNAIPGDYFISDDATYAVTRSSGGEAQLTVAPVAKVGDTEYTSFETAKNNWSENTTLTLLKDVTTESTITVSGTRTLDLNGHGIRMTGTDSVITVASGAALTLNDNNPDVEHKFKVSNPASNGAGLAIVDDGLTSGYQTFTGGYITGGNGRIVAGDARRGGGIYISGGTVYLSGGTIIGNSANDHGGGVNVERSGTFTMTGGEICYNTSLWGGGLNSYGAVIISGGTIHHNTAHNTASSGGGGGGIELESGGALTMTGGTVTENRVSAQSGDMWKGGGVHLPSGATLTISGNPVITGNYQGSGTTPNNLFIRYGLTVTVGSTLTTDASLGVTMETPGVFTSGWKGIMGEDADPAGYFVSDSSSYILGKNADGELRLDVPCTVSYDANGGSGTMTDGNSYAAGSAVTALANAFTRDGYSFSGWNTAADGSGTAYAAGGTFTIAADTTLYAQWTQNYSPAPEPTKKEPTPGAVFTATGPDAGTLSNIPGGARYRIGDGGWKFGSGSVELTGISPCTITLYKPGDGVNTKDSDTQTITVTKAETPKLTVTQPTEIGGTGSVNVTSAHEYSADDGKSWTDCTEGQGFAAGVYLFRVKANGTALASDAQSVMITTIIPDEGGTEYVIDGKTVKTSLYVNGENTPAVLVGGLDVEAAAVSEGALEGSTVLLTMSVETKTAEDAAAADALLAIAPEESTLEFLDISVSKIVNGNVVPLTETQNVLEIIVPYSFKGKEFMTAYRYHNGVAEKLLESDTRADGTYFLDKENGTIHIFMSKFSIYAIGYTQCYNLKGVIQFGRFTGNITVSLLDTAKNLVAATDCTPNSGISSYSFTHIPKGTYYLSATWMENGRQVSLNKRIEVK